MLKSIDYDRLLTSEGTKTLTLAFFSKTGQYVEHTRQRNFFIWISLSERGYIKAFCRLYFRPQT